MVSSILEGNPSLVEALKVAPVRPNITLESIEQAEEQAEDSEDSFASLVDELSMVQEV